MSEAMTALEKIRGKLKEKFENEFLPAVLEMFAMPKNQYDQIDENVRRSLIAYAMSTFGWRESVAKDEIRKIGRAEHKKRIAGTKKQREKTAKALADATADFQKRKPEIDAAIKELEEERSGLGDTRDRLDAQLKESTKAAEELCSHDYIPKLYMDDIFKLRQELSKDENAGGIVTSLIQERGEMERIIAGPVPETRDGAGPEHQDDRKEFRFCEFLQSIGEGDHVQVDERISEISGGKIFDKTLKPSFSQLLSEAKKMLPKLESQLADAKEAKQRAESEMNKLRNYHIV